MHGEAAVRAAAGERCAISIIGANVEQVRRGDWLLAPPLHAPAERLDVHLRVLGSEARPLRHWTPVHLHLGTRDVTARLAMRRGGVIDAGATGRAQLILESPIAALHGDRFILRDQSGRRTIAGGTVLDPWAPHGRIDREQRSRQLDALAAEDATNALHRLAVVTPSGVDLAWFGRAFNMDARTLHELVQRAGLQMVGKDAAAVALPRASIEAIRNSIGYELGKFHRQFATAAGMEVTQLRECCAPALPLPLFRAMLRSLADDKALEFTGTLVRKTGHLAVENPLDVRLWACVRPTLESAGRGGIAISQLAAQTRQREPVLREFLLRKASIGVIVRVTPDRFFLRSQMAAFAATATRLAQDAEDGRFSAAEFRDRCAIGRTLAIDVLETLDRLAVTRRVGDARLLCQDFVPILGPAEPLSPIVPQRPPRPSSASRR
jgi:selenocysteine-specific elongation factor